MHCTQVALVNDEFYTAMREKDNATVQQKVKLPTWLLSAPRHPTKNGDCKFPIREWRILEFTYGQSWPLLTSPTTRLLAR